MLTKLENILETNNTKINVLVLVWNIYCKVTKTNPNILSNQSIFVDCNIIEIQVSVIGKIHFGLSLMSAIYLTVLNLSVFLDLGLSS